MTGGARGPLDPFADPFAAEVSRVPTGHLADLSGRRARRVPGEVGIWVFVFGDLIVFTLFFVVLLHERSRDAALFERGRESLDPTFGAVNTLLLLTGSLFVVLGLEAVRHGDSRRAPRMILVTLVCGTCFVLDKYLEYASEVGAGHTPSTNRFFMYYFVFTGIHLLHLLLGLVVLSIMYRLARKPHPRAADLRLLEAGACYWHLVDLLWIILFALLYLMR